MPSRPRSAHGGRHELGQNFLCHPPTIDRIVELVSTTEGDLLEIGAGDGALTRPLAGLGRALVALEIDEHRAAALRADLPDVDIRTVDALRHPWDAAVIVGNLPFHLTTPLLRRLLAASTWRTAVVLTQWEVARKRAGVGGRTLMTAQAAPWFEFSLIARVPARHFRPAPSVDGGLLRVDRRPEPLVPENGRHEYERLVRAVFTGRGRTLPQIVGSAAGVPVQRAAAILTTSGVSPAALPRDLNAHQWAALWTEVGR